MTKNTERIARLSEIPAFADVPEEVLAEIAKVGEYMMVPAGTTIFRQGDQGDNCYIVNSGKVRIFKKSSEGIHCELDQLGSGECFGEIALLTGQPRLASVETVEETHLIVLPKVQFDRILKKYPDVSYIFTKQMSDWLLRADSLIQMEAERHFRPPTLSWIDFLLIVSLSVAFAIIFNQTNPNGIKLFPKIFSGERISTVSAASAIQEHEQGEALFVDAMPSSFYEQQHITDAVNVPLALFDIMYMMALSGIESAEKIIVYGRTISRRYDEQIANKLIVRGHRNVRILEGGLSTWKKKGYPVEP